MREKHWKTDYFILLHWINATLRFVFRHIQLGGNIENWPCKKPILWAPNHQNAFLDGVLIECNTRENTYHLIRGGAFGNKWLDKLFAIVHLIPIYRERDGIAAVKKNAQIMDKCYDILSKNESVVIFPEGRHSDSKKLLPLQKGVGRMALGMVEKYGWNTGFVLWPVGLNYDNPEKIGAEVFMNFGRPIELAEFKPLYDENPRKALVAILKELTLRMSEVMIDIESEEYYESIEFIRELYVSKEHHLAKFSSYDLERKFELGKKITVAYNEFVRNNPDEMADFHPKVLAYKKVLSDFGIRNYLFIQPNKNAKFLAMWFSLLLLFPVAVFGTINNWLPFYFTKWVANNKIKEPQFKGSILMAGAMPIYTIWYIILLIFSAIFLPLLWMKACYLPIIWLTGYFTRWFYYRWLIKTIGVSKFLLLKRKPEFEMIKEMRKDILDNIQSVMKK